MIKLSGMYSCHWRISAPRLICQSIMQNFTKRYYFMGEHEQAH